MNSIQRTQENRIVKVFEGIKLFLETLGEGSEAITPEERIEQSGIKELQKPLKSEKILEEKITKKRGNFVEEAEVSLEKASKALKQNTKEQKDQEKEM